MDVQNDHLTLAYETGELERLRGELEQARVALEDMDVRIMELSASSAELQDRLGQELRRRAALEQEVQQLRAATVAAPPESGTEIALREQLSTVLEELHVMAEELTLAQDALRHAADPH